MKRNALAKSVAALGWTQDELARRSGVAQSTISLALNGKPVCLETAGKLYNAITGRGEFPMLSLGDLVRQ